MSCKRQVRNSADLVAILIEELSAVVALGIGFPTLFCTGGRFCVNICLVRVGARCIFYRYSTGGGLVACLCRNGCRAGGYRSYLTGVVNRCNGLLA